MNSLGGGFGALLGLSPEKKRQQQFATIVGKSEKTESDIEFMIKYLESVCKDDEVKQLRETLDQSEFLQLLRSFKISNLKPEDCLAEQDVKYGEIDLAIVLSGQLALFTHELKYSGREFSTGSMIYLKEGEQDTFGVDNNKYRLVCKAASTQVVSISRSVLDGLLKASEDKFQSEYKAKLECLCIVFPSLAKESLSEQRKKSRKFQLFPHNKAGSVITTITSGSNDIFVIAKGSVLVWMPKSRINADYTEEFVVIGLLSANTFFNEQNCLFAKECNYGTMVVSEESEIYVLKREDVNDVCKGVPLDNMKASSEIRDRMYKAHQKRYMEYKTDLIQEKQLQLCKNIGIEYSNVKKLFESSSKNSKIVTVNLIDSNAFSKNLEKFNKLAKASGFKTTELQGDKELIASSVTPRLVSKASELNSLTPAEQLSLISLRKSAKGLREGTQSNVNFKVSEMDQSALEKEKQEVSQNLASGFLIRKNIQQVSMEIKPVKKVDEESKEEPSAQKPAVTVNPIATGVPAFKSLQQRLDSTNDSLLKKLGQMPSALTSTTAAGSGASTSEFSLKSSIKPMNSVFLNIEKAEIQSNAAAAAAATSAPPAIKKPDDKFAAQRKKLMNFGI